MMHRHHQWSWILFSRYKIITGCISHNKFHQQDNASQQASINIREHPSELLDAGELLRILNALDNPRAVLDMGGVILDSRVEDVGEAVLAHEDVGEDADALEDGIVAILVPPHLLQVVDRVHLLLVLLYVQQQVVDGELPPLKNRLQDTQVLLDVLLDETQDRLPVIFGNVLGFIFVVAFLLSIFGASFFCLFSDSNFNSLGGVLLAILHFYGFEGEIVVISR